MKIFVVILQHKTHRHYKNRTPMKKKPTRKKHPASPLQFASAVVLVTVGVGLLIAGFALPPTGAIDSSVLVAFGEILTFVGAIFGIDYHYTFKK